MPQEFRVGIVGMVSAYSLMFAEALSQSSEVAFAGVAHLGRGAKYIRDALNLHYLSRFPRTVKSFRETYQVRVYEQPEELIEAGAVDGVCICTEDYLHAHHALRAIEKGVHVFVPKPFASRHEDAVRMFDGARAKGVVLLGSVPLRFNPSYVKASDLIDEGAIGRPLSGHFQIIHHLTLGGWKSDPTMAAGPEYEMGFYIFDAMRWLMRSEPQTVMAFGANLDHRGIPYIDNATCIVQFESGAMASADLRLGMHHPFPRRGFEIIGDEGALTLETDPQTGQQMVAVYTRSGTERHPVRAAGDYKCVEMLNWVKICQTGQDPTPWQKEALHSLDLMTAFKRAYECGAPVTLPLPEATQ